MLIWHFNKIPLILKIKSLWCLGLQDLFIANYIHVILLYFRFDMADIIEVRKGFSTDTFNHVSLDIVIFCLN